MDSCFALVKTISKNARKIHVLDFSNIICIDNGLVKLPRNEENAHESSFLALKTQISPPMFVLNDPSCLHLDHHVLRT